MSRSGIKTEIKTETSADYLVIGAGAQPRAAHRLAAHVGRDPGQHGTLASACRAAGWADAVPLELDGGVCARGEARRHGPACAVAAGGCEGGCRRAAAAILRALEVLQLQPQIGRPVEQLADKYREWVIQFGDSGCVARCRFDGEVVTVALRLSNAPSSPHPFAASSAEGR
jgi:hypothetical protein